MVAASVRQSNAGALSMRASRMGVTGGGASTDMPRASHIGASALAVRVQKNAASTHDAQKNHLKGCHAIMSGWRATPWGVSDREPLTACLHSRRAKKVRRGADRPMADNPLPTSRSGLPAAPRCFR
jgi:hypothetical protein